jgi:hypothetical protein
VVYPSDGEPSDSYHLVDNETKEPMFVSSADPTGFEDKNIAPADVPKLDFINVSPTEYVVNISGATVPYYLVLSESFDPNWKVYVTDGNKPISFWDTLFGSSLPEETHLEVNGYANAWRIEKSGNYTIVIEFRLQWYFYLGLIISSITLLGCLGYLGWHFMDRRKKQHGMNHPVL